MRWEPGQYGRFAGPRLRPGIDLLARVPLEGAASVVDLGCGSGALFPALRARFPGAELTGVDNSPEMLAQAHRVDEGATLVEADAASWRPDRPPVDVIFSNALLHWVPDHAKLLPALLGSCRVLVVQMPANFAAPSHQLIGEIAARPRWVDRLGGIRLGEHVLGLPAYRRLLAPLAAEVDLVEADAATWRPEEPVDLIFSNASCTGYPTTRRCCRGSSGAAASWPSRCRRTSGRPSHRLVGEIAARPRWAAAWAASGRASTSWTRRNTGASSPRCRRRSTCGRRSTGTCSRAPTRCSSG
jgi:trans-aconitate 2-methyltransferase